MRFRKWMVSGVLVLSGGMMWAGESVDLADLERRVTSLSEEVSTLKAANKPNAVYQPVFGLAPAASKVYHLKEGVSLGGYGEMVYQDFDAQKDSGAGSDKKNRLDYLRFVLYAGFRFSEKFVLNSEIEFEHAAEDKRGEISVEMVSLDYLMTPSFNARGGLLLVPMGFLNELHEPAVYHGVNRPNVERNIIPTTWRENGVGVFGQTGSVSYRAYIINGFQAVNDFLVGGSSGNVKGYSASGGLRDGRQKGSNTYAEDFGVVGRVDYSGVPGLLVGGSYYSGESGQSVTVSSEKLSARTALWEAHGDYQWEGVELRGLYSRVTVGQVSLINTAQGFIGNKSVGERMWGGYGQVAYNVMSRGEKGLYLAPFFRYERYNTQARVPDGFVSDPANDRTEMVYGLTFKPIATVVLKGEYQNNRNRADSAVDQWNLGLGYMF